MSDVSALPHFSAPTMAETIMADATHLDWISALAATRAQFVRDDTANFVAAARAALR